jgi:hypothetical protein
MPSPFPGMNPYLERSGVWETFHLQLLSVAQQQLTAQIDPRYVVTIGTRMYVAKPRGGRRLLGVADLGIQADPGGAAGRPAAATAATATAPMYMNIPKGVRVRRRRFLQIRTQDGLEVVTEVEVLSPGNKRGGGDYKQYLRKRHELMRSNIHFVEVDLLRGGGRMPMDGEMPEADYCGVVCRVEELPQARVWAWRLRDPIPLLPVPLGEGHADARLDLKAAIDELYDRGDYARFIYRKPPEPPLGPEDAAWAAQFLPPGAAPPGGDAPAPQET